MTRAHARRAAGNPVRDFPRRLLALDIGNSNITIGAFHGERLSRVWRIETDPSRGSASYGREIRRLVAGLDSGPLDGVVYASVVPRLDRVFESLSRRALGLRAVGIDHRSRLGFAIRVDKASEVGADRLVNTLAAIRLIGTPAVVIDFGTATTFDCVSGRGEYLGGAILPGPDLAAKSLALYTARLPEVRMRPTRRVIGKNTVECIQAGLYHGYLGMIEGLLDKTIAELRRDAGGGNRRVKIVATGGLAGVLCPALPRVSRVIPDLTLQGLRLAYEILC